jgi:hypothetical protein
MPRGPMSEAHKAKLAKGREAAAKAKQEAEDGVARDWLAWNKKDAELYAARHEALVGGISTKEYVKADATYKEHRATQPPLPNNASVRRVKGLDILD